MKKSSLFFNEHEIKYYVIGGTLLGTIRHQGFIPWDDDIDIGIPRDSYLRLIDICRKNKNIVFDLTFCFQEINSKFYYGFAKIYDNKSTLIEKGLEELFGGVYIDIFPLDYSTQSIEVASKTVEYIQGKRRLQSLKGNFKSNNKYKNVIRTLLKPFEKVFISNTKIKMKIDKAIFKNNDENKDKKYLVNYYGAWGIKEIYDIKWFDSYIEMPFAYLKVRVPIGYHEVLTKTYGNYMELPPIDKQISYHDYYLDLNTPDTYREYMKKSKKKMRGRGGYH